MEIGPAPAISSFAMQIQRIAVINTLSFPPIPLKSKIAIANPVKKLHTACVLQ